MRKFIKITLITLLTLILLGAISLFVVIKYVDPNSIKNALTHEIKKTTGKDLQIKGDINWSLFPWVALSLNDVTVANQPGFGETPFLQAKLMHFSVKLFPLFKGAIKIGKIEFDNLKMNLMVNREGKNNWEQLENHQNGNPNNSTDSTNTPQTIDISSIEINNSDLHWRDEQTGERFLLNGVDLSGSISVSKDKNGQKKNNQHIPVNLIRRLKLNGKLHVNTIQSTKLKAKNFSAKFSNKNGILKIEPMNAELYGGKFIGELTLDASKSTPELSVHEALISVQAEPLFTDLQYTNRIRGTLQANMKLNSTNAEDFSKTVSGNASIALNDGALTGVNLRFIVDTAVSMAKHLSKPSLPESNSTPFSKISGTFTISNGIINNDDFQLISPNLSVTGKGKASLIDQRLNCHLLAKVTGTKTDDIESLQSALTDGIPLKVSGTFSDYKVQPDYAVIMKAGAKLLLKKNIESIKKGTKAIGKEIKKDLHKLLD